jgi:uncharacterized protein (DUF58 family)
VASLAQYLDPAVIAQVSRLDLRARFIVEGFLAGLHRSPFQGLSVEFSEHRKYSQGDDLRSIDWNVFARTDRLYVRRYAAETHLQCHLIVDASASMGYVGPLPAPEGANANTKLTYAVHLAAALGYLITQQQDAVGASVIAGRIVRSVPARSRRSDLVNLLGVLATARPEGSTGLAAGIHEVVDKIPHRGLIIVMSDLLADNDALLRAMHHIRFRGHDLIVMHILDAVEVDMRLRGAAALLDPESDARIEIDADGVREEYSRAVVAWRDGLAASLRALRADFLPLDTATPFHKALVEFLIQRSRRR